MLPLKLKLSEFKKNIYIYENKYFSWDIVSFGGIFYPNVNVSYKCHIGEVGLFEGYQSCWIIMLLILLKYLLSCEG